MEGTHAQTGKQLGGIDHMRQSIVDILTTPKGSRVRLRDYGSDLFSYIDKPMNASTRMDIIAAVATALDIWEPRFQLSACDVKADQNGRVTLDLTGNYLPDGRQVRLDGIVVN